MEVLIFIIFAAGGVVWMLRSCSEQVRRDRAATGVDIRRKHPCPKCGGHYRIMRDSKGRGVPSPWTVRSIEDYKREHRTMPRFPHKYLRNQTMECATEGCGWRIHAAKARWAIPPGGVEHNAQGVWDWTKNGEKYWEKE